MGFPCPRVQRRALVCSRTCTGSTVEPDAGLSSTLEATLVAQTVKHLLAIWETWVRKILWGRKWQPTPVPLPGKPHGRRSLVGYSPRGRKESDTTEQLHFPLSFPNVKSPGSFMGTPHPPPPSILIRRTWKMLGPHGSRSRPNLLH